MHKAQEKTSRRPMIPLTPGNDFKQLVKSVNLQYLSQTPPSTRQTTCQMSPGYGTNLPALPRTLAHPRRESPWDREKSSARSGIWRWWRWGKNGIAVRENTHRKGMDGNSSRRKPCRSLLFGISRFSEYLLLVTVSHPCFRRAVFVPGTRLTNRFS